MTDCWVAPESLFDGQDIVYGQAVRIVDGRITEIAKTPDSAVRIKGCLTPGFVDLQVNGGGGVLLNNTPTADGMARIAAAHWKHGRRSRAFTEARKQIWADLRAVEARMRADGLI